MGSGNKEKRRRRQTQASPLKSGSSANPNWPLAPEQAGERPAGDWPRERWQGKDLEDSGVNFEADAEADRVFLESMGAIEGESFAEAFEVDPEVALSKRAIDRRQQESHRNKVKLRSKARPGHRQLEIDLHGLSLSEALVRVDQTIQPILAQLAAGSGEVTLKIITGKGLHSGTAGGVLAREVHRHVRDRFQPYITSMEASPAEVTLGGVPLRGHFHVTFGRTGGKERLIWP